MASQPSPSTYDAYRGRLEDYFDRTARQNWVDLTSDTKVSGIRATVRAGRDRMRAMLLETQKVVPLSSPTISGAEAKSRRQPRPL